LLGLNTLWLWVCSTLFVFTTLITDQTSAQDAVKLRHVTVANVFEELGVPTTIQAILFFIVSLFFIAWGIWTLRDKKSDPDSLRSGTRWIFVFIAVPLLIIGGYSLGRHETTRKAQAYFEKMDDIYIPANIQQCFEQIDLMLGEEQIELIKAGTKDDMISYHHGLGTGIRNSFGLWRGPLIGTWFRERGVDHPDNMSGIILDAYWRYLNDKPIEIEDLIRESHEYYKEDDPELYAVKIQMLETACEPKEER
jgi:hypothetical protein